LAQAPKNILLPFCYPTAEYWPRLEGISQFETYPRTEQDQLFRDESSLRGTVPSELQNRLRSSIPVAVTLKCICTLDCAYDQKNP
jgi:hypothetical protein